jgi:hypothetical protein
MGKSADLNINVTANAKPAQNELSKIEKQLNDFSKVKGTGAAASFLVWTEAAKNAGQIISKVYQSARELVDLYTVQQQAEVRLAATIRATSNVMGMSASQLGAMASGLQKVTKFGDETILGVQQLFVATKALTSDQMPMAVELSLDLAEAMGTDAASAAKVMAKALADPATGLMTLREKNIFFTKSEKDKIVELQASNKLQAAQQIILDKVAASYGGIAREVAATDTGKITQIKNLMGDIKEGLGQAIVRALGPTFVWLLERLGEVQTRINDMNASRDLMVDLRGGANVGLKYGPEAIQTEMARINSNLVGDENQLRIAYAGSKGIRPEDAGAFITQPRSYWVEQAGGQHLMAYDRMKANKEDLQRLGQAYIISKNKPAESVPGVGAVEGSAGSAASVSATGKAKTLYEDILGITSATVTAQKISLETKIKENEHLRGFLDMQVIAGKMTKEEAETSKQALTEQIALDKERLNELLKGKEELKASEVISAVGGQFSGLMSAVASFNDQAFQREIDALQTALDKQREMWDKYYAELKDKHRADRDALDAKYQWGVISAEEYQSSLAALDAAKLAAEEEAAGKEEELAKKLDAMKKRQFEADKTNSIAQALINGALAITQIWATVKNPILAGVLTGLSAATTGVQVGAIASQQYTPLAVGGVATGPTHALIGEGGEPEMVLPLSKARDMGFGGGGNIYFSVYVQNAYTGDDLSKSVYQGIEKAQRTGGLPPWKKVAAA